MAEKVASQDCHCICKVCGSKTETFISNGNLKSASDTLHLFQEIENLNRQLAEREYYILNVETNMLKHAEQFPNGEWEYLQQELFNWKNKYERLLESHRKLQKVNQGLEDKLLKLVDKFESEKNSLTKDIADMTTQLVEARLSIDTLEIQNEQYRSDCNIAIQLLQCKPSNFVSHKLSAFPSDLQEKVRLHFAHQPRKELPNSHSSPNLRTIRVPIPTFPPTAMVYSVNNGVPSSISDSESFKNEDSSETPDYISAAIMAKVLEERTKERIGKIEPCRVCWFRKHSGESKEESTQTRWPSSNFSGLVCNSVPFVKVHTRHRTDSTSSTESHPQQARNGSFSSTETTI